MKYINPYNVYIEKGKVILEDLYCRRIISIEETKYLIDLLRKSIEILNIQNKYINQ